MEKTAVIYKTKYGSAKKYAEWLADELDADIFECSKEAFENIEKYDNVIYGGSMYAVGILGFDTFKENYLKIADKKTVVFTVGASPAWDEAVREVRETNFTDEMMQNVLHVHLRGGFDFKSLNLLDKVLMTLLKAKLSLKKKENLLSDEKGMLASYEGSHDWTSKKALAPILEYIRKG